MSRELDVARSLAASLVQCKNFREVWFVGSAVQSQGNCSGMDLLVAYENQDFHASLVIARQLTGARADETDWILSDDSLIGKIESLKIGIAFHDRDALRSRIERYCNGCDLEGLHRAWASGYWLPEALCADLAYSVLLEDPSGMGWKLVQSLLPYPEKMAQAIERLCRDEIFQKLTLIQSGSVLAWDLEMGIRCSDVAVALIRFAFAVERKFLRGFHHLDDQRKVLVGEGNRIIDLAERILGQGKQSRQIVIKIKEDIESAVSKCE